jgi:hypothetical protein
MNKERFSYGRNYWLTTAAEAGINIRNLELKVKEIREETGV